MVYDKKSYENYMEKIKSDPILYEEWKKKQRERHYKRYESKEYREKQRNRTKKWGINKRKEDPNYQKKENKRQREHKYKQRLLCIAHYSNNKMCCSCCGETEYMFLEIDHTNGGGNNHRKSIGKDRIESWLIKNNFPKGFGVLCCNCNKGKHLNGGICPHKV